MRAEGDDSSRSTAGAMAIVVGAVGLFGAFVLALVLVWGSAGERRGVAEARAEEAERREALAGLEIPEFVLRAQDGREVTRADLVGRWTVLSFGFTHCTLVCPIMHGQLYRLQGLVDDLPNVRLLTVSVDPEHDTVERLAEYAAQIGADPGVWTFARTDGETLGALMTDGLGLGLQVDAGTQIDMGGGAMMDNLVHSSRLVVVSPEGRVVGMYRGTDPGDVDRLAADVRRWAR